jgi:hypothetical protein
MAYLLPHGKVGRTLFLLNINRCCNNDEFKKIHIADPFSDKKIDKTKPFGFRPPVMWNNPFYPKNLISGLFECS